MNCFNLQFSLVSNIDKDCYYLHMTKAYSLGCLMIKLYEFQKHSSKLWRWIAKLISRTSKNPVLCSIIYFKKKTHTKVTSSIPLKTFCPLFNTTNSMFIYSYFRAKTFAEKTERQHFCRICFYRKKTKSIQQSSSC